MDLDILERNHLADIGAFERAIAAKASRMTLREVDAELTRLPASPRNDRDLLARAAMMKRRGDIIEAARPDPNAPPPGDEPGMVEIAIPDGVNVFCIQSQTRLNKFYYREMRDGRWVIRAPWSAFYALVFGENGAPWLAVNPSLVDRMPKNPPPPVT